MPIIKFHDAITRIAIPIIRHSIIYALRSLFFLTCPVIKYGITNKTIKPMIIENIEISFHKKWADD